MPVKGASPELIRRFDLAGRRQLDIPAFEQVPAMAGPADKLLHNPLLNGLMLFEVMRDTASTLGGDGLLEGYYGTQPEDRLTQVGILTEECLLRGVNAKIVEEAAQAFLGHYGLNGATGCASLVQ